MDRSSPERVGVGEHLPAGRGDGPRRGVRVGGRPVVLDDLHRPAITLRREQCQHLLRRPPLVERGDQRLHQRDGAVVGAVVSPALERVRRRQIPVRERRGLVDVLAVVGDERHLRHPLGEPQVRRRGEDRVAAEDHEHFHLTGVHRRGELRDRREAIHGTSLDGGGGVGDRRAGVAQRFVHRASELVHGRRLILARHDEAAAAVRLKVFGGGGDELRDLLAAGTWHRCPRRRRRRRSDGARQLARDRLDLRGANGQAVIGLRSSERGRALDRVEAIGVLAIVHDAPARGEITLVSEAAGTAIDEVGIERDDDVRLVEVVDRPAVGRRHALRTGRIELVPARLRIRAENRRHHVRERRGRDRTGQEPQARALLCLLSSQRLLRGGEEVPPRTDVAALGDDLRAIRIVEIEDLGLREDVRRAEAGGVLRIAFDFGRMPHVALDQHRPRVSALYDRTRKEQRTSRHDVFGLLHVRDDLLRGLPRTGADAGERQRRAHQLQELAAPLRVVPLGRLVRELAMQVFAELGRVGQFADAPPVQAALGAGQSGADDREIHFVLASGSRPLTFSRGLRLIGAPEGRSRRCHSYR